MLTKEQIEEIWESTAIIQTVVNPDEFDGICQSNQIRWLIWDSIPALLAHIEEQEEILKRLTHGQQKKG